jgi:hypothetical protein
VLGDGEEAYETDTGRQKIGDGTTTYNSLEYVDGDWIKGGYLGDIVPRMGNAVAPSSSHPRFCLTNFSGSSSLSATNWPLLVPWLRDQQLIYLEGLSGETSTFAGTAAASVITLTSTTANNDLLAALVEFQADYGTYTNWLTLDWDGTTYAITDVDAATREITVTGTPTAGAGTVTIYPHRIAGSTTTARVHSAVGKDLRAAGTTEYLAGLMWRDQMQGITGSANAATSINILINDGATFGAFSGTGSSPLASRVASTSGGGDGISFDSGDSSSVAYGAARAGATTRGAGMGVHFYLHGGRYSS